MVSALSSNFGLIGFTVLEIERFIYFGILAWNCLLMPTFRGFWGIFSPNDVIYLCNPQKGTSLRLSHEGWKSVQRFDLGAGSRKRTGQDKTGQSKKSQRRYISLIWGEAPTEPIFTKICTVVAVPDVITCANFELKFSGVTILQGIEFHVFLLILSYGPYNSVALLRCMTVPVMKRCENFVPFIS